MAIEGSLSYGIGLSFPFMNPKLPFPGRACFPPPPPPSFLLQYRLQWWPSISWFNGNGGRERKINNRYDVFLSFRGQDVRKGFVDHLYHALTGVGFHVFLDTHHLLRGYDISAGLQHAIEVSRILIPIFSINYAQSAWCLREVSLIEKGRKNGLAIVVPLFYNVTPTQVRHPDQAHGSPFAEAFREHERSGKYGAQEIDEWKDALSAISRLSGWSLQENTNGYEAALVKRVVQGLGKLCKRRTTRL